MDGAAGRRARADRHGERAPAGAPARPGDGAPGPDGGEGMATVKSNGMRTRSSVVFDGPERAFARAYMKGIGFGDDDLSRPTVGIANTWTEAMPCNFHLRG